jgi:hypothetical protein
LHNSKEQVTLVTMVRVIMISKTEKSTLMQSLMQSRAR